jgi:hypothetical protein
MSDTQTLTTETQNAEALAEEADRRALEATTQDERERWQRIAAEWWDKA